MHAEADSRTPPTTGMVNRLADALGRTTARGDFIPAVDGLRFIAIFAIVFHHITAEYIRGSQRFGPIDLPRQWWDVFPASPILTAGYVGHFGVPLFFVISGFILALPYVRSRDFNGPAPSIWSYYLRRIVRLDPPYIASLLIAFAIISLSNVGWRVFFPHLGASLFYLHGPIYGEASWVSGVAWSLEVEVQFYLLVPFLAKLFIVRPLWLRRTMLLVLTISWAYAASSFITFERMPRLSMSIVNHLQFFLAGFLLADFYVHHRAVPSFAGDLVTLSSAAAIYWVLTKNYSLYFLTPIMIGVMYAGLVSGKIGSRMVTQRWIVIIGGMCYSIYLVHYLVINLIKPLSARLMEDTNSLGFDLLVQAAAMIPAVLIVSTLFYLGIEKPCMNFSRWIGRKAGV